MVNVFPDNHLYILSLEQLKNKVVYFLLGHFRDIKMKQTGTAKFCLSR